MILPCDLPDPNQQLLVKAPPCTVRLSLCVCIVSSEGHGFSVQKKELLCTVEAFPVIKSVAASHQQHKPLHRKDLSSFCDSSKVNCCLRHSVDLKFKEICIIVWKRNLTHLLENEIVVIKYCTSCNCHHIVRAVTLSRIAV